MGRSVSTPRDCSEVCFRALGEDSESFEYDCLKEWVVSESMDSWPSFYPCEKWIGRENLALLENQHAHIGISEYCGLVAIWLVVRDDSDYLVPQLAEAWCNRIAPKFNKLFSELSLIATASNGEAFYQKIS